MEHVLSQPESEDWIKVDISQQSTDGSDQIARIDLAQLVDDIDDHTKADKMQLHVRPHFAAVDLERPSRVLGMASLKAPGIGSSPRISELDIIAVIDRSGSMSGLRIDLVKKALRFISKQLRSGDRLAIVSYSDTASVDLPLTLMDSEGQAVCSEALENLHAGGCTNLGEGLLWGLGELASSSAPAAALLLFTDGLANRGMTKTEELVEAMQGPLSDMGRSSRVVFSFGLGQDHNAQMLFSLADAGTGCYYYVDTALAIAPSFADCLGGMLSVVAQDVYLNLHAKNGSSISSIHADFNVDLNEDKTEARIKMRDLSSDSEKEVLFDLCVPADANAGTLTVLTCTLSYIDVVDGVAETQHGDLVLQGLWNGEEQPNADVIVEVHRCRLLTAKAMEQAVDLLGKSDDADAQRVLSEALHALENSPARTSKQGNACHLIATLSADLNSCLDNLSNPRSCEKLCSSRAFAHKHQISTKAEGSEYRNALQKSLAEAARREIEVSSVQEVSRVARKGRRNFQPPRRASENISGPASSPSPSAGTIAAGALRAGMRVMCRGQPGTVEDVSLSKTGKHGHAKAFFSVIGDDGIKRQDVVPSSHDVELAHA